jgi:hypothetical protein
VAFVSCSLQGTLHARAAMGERSNRGNMAPVTVHRFRPRAPTGRSILNQSGRCATGTSTLNQRAGGAGTRAHWHVNLESNSKAKMPDQERSCTHQRHKSDRHGCDVAAFDNVRFVCHRPASTQSQDTVAFCSIAQATVCLKRCPCPVSNDSFFL